MNPGDMNCCNKVGNVATTITHVNRMGGLQAINIFIFIDHCITITDTSSSSGWTSICTIESGLSEQAGTKSI